MVKKRQCKRDTDSRSQYNMDGNGYMINKDRKRGQRDWGSK